MRRILMPALLAVFLAAAPARAGVYSTAEKADPQAEPIPHDLFTRLLNDQRELRREEPPSQLRQRYLKQRDDLQAKVRAGAATIDDKINLSAYLIGLGQFEEATRLLEPEARGEHRSHPLLFANLAAAYFQMGLLDRAFDYQRETLANWPKQRPGFTPEQWQWLKEAEYQVLNLIRLRRKAQGFDQVDNLFEMEFVGPSGHYEAGQLADAQKQKLPPRARAIVQQLVLWLPFDDRLYWLLGELLGADGNVEDAFKILDECIWSRRFNSPILKEHRALLSEAQPPPPPPPATWMPEPWKVVVVGIGVGILLLVLGGLQVREMLRRRYYQAS